MRKLLIILSILSVVVIVMGATYILYEPSRATFEGIFGPIAPLLSTTLISLSDSFMALPYWQWIGIGIWTILVIIFDRNMHFLWDIIQWGKLGDPRKIYGRKQETPYQDRPSPQSPTAVTSQPPTTEQLAPPKEEVEA